MQMDQVPGPMPSAGEEYTPPPFFLNTFDYLT